MQIGQPRISPETQYNQEYESWRQHDRFIWQTPTIVAAVGVTAIVASYALNIPWWAREIIFIVDIIFTVVLTFALIKLRWTPFLGQQRGQVKVVSCCLHGTQC
jgi:hypothetical protein